MIKLHATYRILVPNTIKHIHQGKGWIMFQATLRLYLSNIQLTLLLPEDKQYMKKPFQTMKQWQLIILADRFIIVVQNILGSFFIVLNLFIGCPCPYYVLNEVSQTTLVQDGGIYCIDVLKWRQRINLTTSS